MSSKRARKEKDSITKLVNEVKEDIENLNNVAILVKKCSAKSCSTVFYAITGCEQIFVHLMSLYPELDHSKSSENKSVASSDDEAFQKMIRWLRLEFGKYLDLLFSLVSGSASVVDLSVKHGDVLEEDAQAQSYALGAAAIHCLMRMLRSRSTLNSDLYHRLLHALLCYTECEGNVNIEAALSRQAKLIDMFCEEHADGDDNIRQETYRTIGSLCDEQFQSHGRKARESFAQLTLSSLNKLSERGESGKLPEFQQCWIRFLRLQLPVNCHRTVLSWCKERILPHFLQPVLLSGFLYDSFALGDASSLLALEGLYELIVRHGLDCPDFFKNLYNMLQPSIFNVKWRDRFITLLKSCLQSPMLPIYVVAAFAKRMARMCLVSPPHGIIALLPLIYDIFHRHPATRVLIQRTRTILVRRVIPRHSDAVKLRASDYGPDVPIPSDLERSNSSSRTDSSSSSSASSNSRSSSSSSSTSNSSSTSSSDASSSSSIDEEVGVDPFNNEESDPEKCNAIESSLWELSALRNHYYPAITTLVKMFENSLDDFTPDSSQSSLGSLGYQSLFELASKNKSNEAVASSSTPKRGDFLKSLCDSGASVDSVQPSPTPALNVCNVAKHFDLLKAPSEGGDWIDVMKDMQEAANKLDAGGMYMSPGVTLAQAMSAVELMDDKMDSGIGAGLVPSATAVGQGHLAGIAELARLPRASELSWQNVVGVVDYLLQLEALWHEGLPMGVSLLTCLYFHWPPFVDNSILRRYFGALFHSFNLERRLISRVGVNEEEDFSTHSQQFDVYFAAKVFCGERAAELNGADEIKEDDTVADALRMLQTIESELSALCSEATDEAEKVAISALNSRVRFRRLYVQINVSLDKLCRAPESGKLVTHKVAHIEKSLRQALKELDSVEATHSADRVNSTAVQGLFNRKLVQFWLQTAPPRAVQVPSFENACVAMHNVFNEISWILQSLPRTMALPASSGSSSKFAPVGLIQAIFFRCEQFSRREPSPLCLTRSRLLSYCAQGRRFFGVILPLEALIGALCAHLAMWNAPEAAVRHVDESMRRAGAHLESVKKWSAEAARIELEKLRALAANPSRLQRRLFDVIHMYATLIDYFRGTVEPEMLNCDQRALERRDAAVLVAVMASYQHQCVHWAMQRYSQLCFELELLELYEIMHVFVIMDILETALQSHLKNIREGFDRMNLKSIGKKKSKKLRELSLSKYETVSQCRQKYYRGLMFYCLAIHHSKKTHAVPRHQAWMDRPHALGAQSETLEESIITLDGEETIGDTAERVELSAEEMQAKRKAFDEYISHPRSVLEAPPMPFSSPQMRFHHRFSAFYHLLFPRIPPYDGVQSIVDKHAKETPTALLLKALKSFQSCKTLTEQFSKVLNANPASSTVSVCPFEIFDLDELTKLTRASVSNSLQIMLLQRSKLFDTVSSEQTLSSTPSHSVQLDFDCGKCYPVLHVVKFDDWRKMALQLCPPVPDDLETGTEPPYVDGWRLLPKDHHQPTGGGAQ